MNCYQKLVVCDLDKSPIPQEIEQERFDCILYPDVLEHLREPWSLLDSHVKLLKQDGVMIASIPNIRHYSVVINLLIKGNWRYKDMGLMDRSHLRFFTKKTMLELFTRDQLRVTLIKPRSLSGSPLVKKINRLLFNSCEEFLTVQYLICAQKVDL